MEWEVGTEVVALAYVKSCGIPVIFMQNVWLGCPLSQVSFEWDCFGVVVLIVGVTKTRSDVLSP